MAGKRLLDAAKLFNAGQSIAKQHIVLRQQQWDVYSRTSGVAKAVKSQTDRVTVTAGAAYELVKRFNETGPSWQEGQSNRSYQQTEITKDSQQEPEATPKGVQEGELSQDQTDVASKAAFDTSGQSRGDDEGRNANGIPPSLRRREMQRIAESQIPGASAYSQPPYETWLEEGSFSKRPEQYGTELSSLPRVKVPKSIYPPEILDEDISSKDVNQDVFYTPGKSTEDEELPEGANVDGLFSSPRVSRMVEKSGACFKNPYSGRQKMKPKPLPEMVAAGERRKREQEDAAKSAEPEGKTQTANAEPMSASSDAETQELADSIAQEAEGPTASSSSSMIQETPTDTSYEMHESRVPSSRFGRLWQYGGLATSMAFGAVGESFRRMTGGTNEGSLMLSEGNMNRLVAKLSRMRGAALKLGQMMSFQGTWNAHRFLQI